MHVSQLYIYPIKSLGGISVPAANVTKRGFEHDRRWMLVDQNNRFLSQRENAAMALLQVEVLKNGLRVFHKHQSDNAIFIDFGMYKNEKAIVQIWDQFCIAVFISDKADRWFSKILNFTCRLVYMPDDSKIPVKGYNINQSLMSFSDGYPILLLSEASLNNLNNRLQHPLPVDRFRPNLMIQGSEAFEEDGLKEININGVSLYCVSPCQRCVITTLNQYTTEKGKEPLKTLATYRTKNNKVYFGENVVAGSIGKISVGDAVKVITTKESLFQ